MGAEVGRRLGQRLFHDSDGFGGVHAGAASQSENHIRAKRFGHPGAGGDHLGGRIGDHLIEVRNRDARCFQDRFHVVVHRLPRWAI